MHVAQEEAMHAAQGDYCCADDGYCYPAECPGYYGYPAAGAHPQCHPYVPGQPSPPPPAAMYGDYRPQPPVHCAMPPPQQDWGHLVQQQHFAPAPLCVDEQYGFPTASQWAPADQHGMPPQSAPPAVQSPDAAPVLTPQGCRTPPRATAPRQPRQNRQRQQRSAGNAGSGWQQQGGGGRGQQQQQQQQGAWPPAAPPLLGWLHPQCPTGSPAGPSTPPQLMRWPKPGRKPKTYYNRAPSPGDCTVVPIERQGNREFESMRAVVCAVALILATAAGENTTQRAAQQRPSDGRLAKTHTAPVPGLQPFLEERDWSV
eukprot:TRINITY_DN1264_c0_g2_i3.p3 TRINITY_DN1264_c0_g2~~TRINITY_DN1264_c0_g2_i3.p3  ORF type:complete len:347 (+),score=107.01 TRINITY_DN1264_c0_g2_i3:102-1043(+)